eukprot:Amastigsp_a181299_3.p5 type:complete len:110 gc:universal Amastigsp_a181299_3:630-301(-)
MTIEDAMTTASETKSELYSFRAWAASTRATTSVRGMRPLTSELTQQHASSPVLCSSSSGLELGSSGRSRDKARFRHAVGSTSECKGAFVPRSAMKKKYPTMEKKVFAEL